MKNKKNTLAQELFMFRKSFLLLTDAIGKVPFILKTIYCFLGIATNYIGVYFSAQIVNELAGGNDKDRLLMYVYLTLGSTLGLTLINIVLNRIYLTLESEDWTQIMYLFSKKAMTMDFQDVESDHIKKLYTEITQSHQWEGFGLILLHLRYEEIIKEISRILCSAALAISLFTLPVPADKSEFLFLNSPLTVVAMIILFCLATWLLSKLSVKASTVWKEATEGKMQFANRLFSF